MILGAGSWAGVRVGGRADNTDPCPAQDQGAGQLGARRADTQRPQLCPRRSLCPHFTGNQGDRGTQSKKPQTHN